MQDDSLSDDDVAAMILEKFRQSSVVISLAEIARCAKKNRRMRLAFQVTTTQHRLSVHKISTVYTEILHVYIFMLSFCWSKVSMFKPPKKI